MSEHAVVLLGDAQAYRNGSVSDAFDDDTHNRCRISAEACEAGAAALREVAALRAELATARKLAEYVSGGGSMSPREADAICAALLAGGGK